MTPSPPDSAPPDPGRIDPDESTVDLLEAARAGDPTAWERLDRRYRNVLALVMRGSIALPERARFDTEDLLQSAFLSAYRELNTFEYRGKGSFLRWLTGVMHNRLKSRLRANRTQRRDVARDRPLPGEGGESLPSEAPTPATLVAQAERAARLLEALALLEDEERLAVQWVLIDEVPVPVVAERLGTSISTVRRRVDRGLKTMQRQLGDE